MMSITLNTENNHSLNLKVTETVFERMRGLFGIDMQAVDVDGLWIKPCNSVHTIAMRDSIDLVYLNKTAKILKIVSKMPAWRLSFAFSAHSVIELKSGLAEEVGLEVGQRLN